MKRKHILLALLVLAGTSCSDHELEGTSIQKGQVQVTADIAKSRVGFKEEDNVVYAFWQDGDAITLNTPSQGLLNYTAAVPDDNSTAVVFSPQDIALKDVDAEKVYACYPEATIVDGTVTLPATDVWTDSRPLPFAYAVSSIQESKVSLSFQHTYAFLKLTLSDKQMENVVSTDGDKSVHRVLVKSSSDFLGVLSGYFNFEDRSVTIVHGTNEIELRLSTPFNPAEETERNVYIPVLPIEEGVTISISLIHDHEGGQDVWANMEKQTPIDGFVAGQVYDTDFTKTEIETAEVAYLCAGKVFNERVESLVGGNWLEKVEFITEANSIAENYIDVSSEESKVPIHAYFDQETHILTIGTSAKSIEVVDASYMFYNCHYLRNIEFGNFTINKTTTNMSYMFYAVRDSISLNISNFDTSNVTDMSYMFAECNGLTSLDLSNFDTSNVTAMNNMFMNSGLMSLDLSGFETSNVINMANMFSGCQNLNSLDLSSFNTTSVVKMDSMFINCNSLTTLDLSNFHTPNVTSMSNMFYWCNNLTTLDVSNFETSNVTNMSQMFYNCGLTSLDISNFDTQNVTDMSYMFRGSNLISLDLSNFNMSSVESMYAMFDYCYDLETLKLDNIGTSNPNGIDMSYMFNYCQNLTDLQMPQLNASNITYMFHECRKLTSLDLSNLNTSKVTDMSRAFCGCEELLSLDLSTFDTSNVTNMSAMFVCHKLSTLDISSFNTSKVTDMSEMFLCGSLTSLDLSNFDTSNVTNMHGMFTCGSLTSLDLSNFDTSNVVWMDYMFSGCSNLISLDISGFNTSNVTNMSDMFGGCSSLTSLDLSNFNTSKLKWMSWMFSDCNNLKTLNLSNFNTDNVVDMSYMFKSCDNLMSLNLSNWNMSNTTDVSMMFEYCARISQSCEITALSSTIDFFAGRGDTAMDTNYFTWIEIQ